jgi:hypothetical protein
MFEGKVTHNLWDAGWLFFLSLCQIPADYNASTCAFTMGNYYWWNSRDNNIGLHLLITLRIFIHIWICWLFSVNIDFWKPWQSVNNFIVWIYRLAKMCGLRMCQWEYTKKYISGLFKKGKKGRLIRIGFRQLLRQQTSHLIL